MAACKILCRHIEKCFNLRNLSLASNAFGEKSMCLGSLLLSNPGIIHLNVSGNKLHSESIDAIAFGIANNSTMLRLDLSSCVLSVENAVKVCHPLLTNQLIILDLSQNPVESNFQADPRAYVTQNQHIFIQDNTPGPCNLYDFLSLL
jgi:Ran GTPase-activating protein (RanGAP) involved in mRNA processing and transport